MEKIFRYLVAYAILLLNLLLTLTSCTDSDEVVFNDYFKFNPPSDVTDFHYVENEGVDSDYWIAFKCDSSTIKKIVSNLNLKKNDVATYGGMGGLNSKPTLWWDFEFIKNSVPYTNHVYSSHYFLWYDKTKSKAYFLLFNT